MVEALTQAATWINKRLDPSGQSDLTVPPTTIAAKVDEHLVQKL